MSAPGVVARKVIERLVAPFRANGECASVVRDLHVHVRIADIRHAFDWHVERFRDEREAFRVGLARHRAIAKQRNP